MVSRAANTFPDFPIKPNIHLHSPPKQHHSFFTRDSNADISSFSPLSEFVSMTVSVDFSHKLVDSDNALSVK